MTVLLIKRLIWGDKDTFDALADDIVEVDNETSDTEEAGLCNKNNLVYEEKDVKQATNENGKDDEDEEEEEEDDETTDNSIYDNDGRYRFDTIHSQFQFEFLKEILTSPQFHILYNFYLFLTFASISIATYDFINKTVLFNDSLSTSTLHFCLDAPTAYSYLTYGASIVTHLPYTPALLLCISYMSPEICNSLDTNANLYAYENRLFIWIQFALQSLTTIGIINPDILWIQETSTTLAFILLYNLFSLTTPVAYKNSIDAYTVSYAITICMFGLLLTEYIPAMLSGFIVAIALEFAIPGAFTLLTPDGRVVLLKCLIISSAIMLFETIIFLNNNRLGFNLLFWQICGSIVDVIIISPRPGRFITAE